MTIQGIVSEIETRQTSGGALKRFRIHPKEGREIQVETRQDIALKNGDLVEVSGTQDSDLVLSADSVIVLPTLKPVKSAFPWKWVIAGIAILAVAAAILIAIPRSHEIFLSDLNGTFVANGWGPVEKDMSNGDRAPGDGLKMSIAGVTYAKGLGAHAHSVVQYDLTQAGTCKAFRSDMGVDDETHGAGSVEFQVMADGVTLYDSGPMTGKMPARSVDLDIANKKQLTLVVNPVGAGINSDHADWANARLVCK